MSLTRLLRLIFFSVHCQVKSDLTTDSSPFAVSSLHFTLHASRLALHSLFTLDLMYFLLQKRIQKQMRLVSNRELSEERMKQINKEKRFVLMTMEKKVAVKEAIVAPTVKRKLHQTKRNNRTLMERKAVPKKMNSRLSQWKIIVSWTENWQGRSWGSFGSLRSSPRPHPHVLSSRSFAWH